MKQRLKYYQNAKPMLEPYSKELEQVVLGTLIIDNTAIYRASLLNDDCFYFEKYKEIYKAIAWLFNRSQKIDLITIKNYLKENKSEVTIDDLIELTNRVASAAHIEDHCRLLYQYHIRRELINISHIALSQATDRDPFELIADFSMKLLKLKAAVQKRDAHISVPVSQNIKTIESLLNNLINSAYISTGFNSIDNILHGFLGGELIIIAARPGMGKSAFMLNIINNIQPALFMSLEMSGQALTYRMISSMTGIDGNNLRLGKISQAEWDNVLTKSSILSEKGIYIDESSALDVMEIKARVVRHINEHDIKIVFIDYLQLVRTGQRFGSREQEVSFVAQQLKALAKETNIPIVVASQLSREVEKRNDKRPLLSDLRESGEIEQAADKVMFLFRPEYYGFEAFDDNSSTSGMAEVIIAKHRDGMTGDVRLRWNGALTKFSEIRNENYI